MFIEEKWDPFFGRKKLKLDPLASEMLTYLKLSTFFQEAPLEDWGDLGEQNSQRQALHTKGLFLIYLII